MNKLILIILFAFFATSVVAETIPVPDGFSLIKSVIGDLDKDSINELVAAYNTRIVDVNSTDNVPRMLVIYKKVDDGWVPWKQSKSALLRSQDGGPMWGDPFESIEITKGILIVYHFLGGGTKCSLTDRYRFQNGEFYLIGFTDHSGSPCESWETIDFNLSTGKLIFKYEKDNCDDLAKTNLKVEEALLIKGLKITIQDRYTKEIKYKLPKRQQTIYISMVR